MKYFKVTIDFDRVLRETEKISSTLQEYKKATGYLLILEALQDTYSKRDYEYRLNLIENKVEELTQKLKKEFTQLTAIGG